MEQIVEDILRLKKEKNALILAHFYQIGEIQEIADYVGDSLALARYAAETDAARIIVCGVKFMGESAKVLSPEKRVFIPRIDAGCPMADMVSAEALADYKAQNPDRYIVSYVNTTADVKALTDVCVTSSNALKIMQQLNAEKFLFLPDRNLGGYIKEKLPEKDIELWNGFCITHQRLTNESVKAQKVLHPDAITLAHPECNGGVLALADFVGSTKGIIEYAKTSEKQAFIIATEEGVMHTLNKEMPNKDFYLADQGLVCQNMKKTSLDDLRQCLKNDLGEIFLSDEIVSKAQKSLSLMLALS